MDMIISFSFVIIISLLESDRNMNYKIENIFKNLIIPYVKIFNYDGLTTSKIVDLIIMKIIISTLDTKLKLQTHGVLIGMAVGPELSV